MVAIAPKILARRYAVPLMKLSPCFRQHIRAAVSDHGLNISADAIVIRRNLRMAPDQGRGRGRRRGNGARFSRKNAQLPCRGRRG
jgi:hypothetical protein